MRLDPNLLFDFIKTEMGYETDKELAKAVGVTFAVLSAWRKGKSKFDFQLIFETFSQLHVVWKN